MKKYFRLYNDDKIHLQLFGHGFRYNMYFKLNGSTIRQYSISTLFCGTFGVEGGIRWADTFEMELEDPVLKRRIAHSYDITALPIEG